MTMAAGWSDASCARNSSLVLIVSGSMTRSPSSCARSLTGEAAGFCPRPRGRSGWFTTRRTRKPAATSFSSVGTANCGVPQKTKSICDFRLPIGQSLPLTGASQLPDFTLDEVALERADVADEELAVQVVGLMQEGSGQQLFAGALEGFSVDVLGAHGDAVGARHLLAELGQAEAAFVGALVAFLVDDLGIDEHDLLRRIFLEGDIYDGNAFGDTDLWRSQAEAVSGVHGFEHVLDELAQLRVKDGHGRGRAFQHRVAVFDDGIDHSP